MSIGNAITPAGHRSLREELDRLKREGRERVAERIREALASAADRTENSDLRQAREEQELLERRIAILEERLAAADVVEPDPSNETLELGERVRLRDLDSRRTVEYVLVGSHEVDPTRGRISAVSPLGQAVLGARRGDVVTVEAPSGRRRYRVLAIEGASDAAAA